MVCVSATGFLSESRDFRNLCRRVGTVARRFGITAGRFKRRLKAYEATTRELGCTPTFPVTAVVLRRHSGTFRDLSRNGVELAVHGYVHVNYATASREEQARDFQRATRIFKSAGVPFFGFRAPFLRFNEDTLEVLGRMPFAYDSSHAIHWDVVDRSALSEHNLASYKMLLDFYGSSVGEDNFAMPYLTGGIVEIPVSLPDDEGMIERLGITSQAGIARVWLGILQRTYARGDLFTLQLHPERTLLCLDALAEVVNKAKELSPVVWFATLNDIAAWWKERAGFTLEVSADTSSSRAESYRVRANCSSRATVLVKNCHPQPPGKDWTDGYVSMDARDFVVECPSRPVIGVSAGSAPSLVQFLREEGYIVEQGARKEDCALYIDRPGEFGETQKIPLIQYIESSGAPLIRYWRWPSRARSALTITGDVDSVTIADFVMRILESRWRRLRHRLTAVRNR
jgi:peptidoglycan/xylan/chitin deacetylase (PgdA/CDA1 family)